jgi:hypothetical protein
MITTLDMEYERFYPFIFLFGTFLLHKSRKNGLFRCFLIKKGLIPSNVNYGPLLCSSIVLSSKFYDDVYITNKEYSRILRIMTLDRSPEIQNKISNLSDSEFERECLVLLNGAERILLEALEYQVFETMETLENWIFSFTEM